MGIGLSICRSIIEAHEGRILAMANVSRGATVQITLPASRTALACPPESSPRRQYRGGESRMYLHPGYFACWTPMRELTIASTSLGSIGAL
jgi:hypothetical protein